MKQHELEADQNRVWRSAWLSAEGKALDQLEQRASLEVQALLCDTPRGKPRGFCLVF